MATRTRNLVAGALAILVLTVPSTAMAGTGTSEACFDGTTTGGGTELLLVDTGVTLAVEVSTTAPYVQLCYSTTEPGNPSTAATGGWVEVNVDNGGFVTCTPDTNVFVEVQCNVADFNPTTGTTALALTVEAQGRVIGLTTNVDIRSTPLGTICLRNTTVYAGVATIGPFSTIGVCP